MSPVATKPVQTPVADFWWEDVPEDQREELDAQYARAVLRNVQLTEDQNSEIHQRFLRHGRMYDPNCELEGVTAHTRHGTIFDQGGITENVLQSAIQTYLAIVAKNQPKATFLTDDMDFKAQKNAQRMERFVEGEFHRTKLYRKGIQIPRDAAVWGPGILWIYEEDGRIACQRVMADHFIVDEEECRSSGEPRNPHMRHFVDVSVLKATYGKEFWDAIDRAAIAAPREYNTFRLLKKHQVPVIYSWHLPSKKGGDDGRMSISIPGATLYREVYRKDYVPFAIFQYEDRLTGFYGRGLVESGAGLQRKVNKHNRMIDRLHDMFGFPRMAQKASDAAAGIKITNKPGEIVTYNDQPPVVIQMQAVPPEIYADKRESKQTIYELSGVAEHAANATVPKGLETGAAVREFNETPALRFAIHGIALEEWYMECARQYVELARDIYKREGKLTTVWKVRNYAKTIDFGQIDLAEDGYVMSIAPSSLLGRTPAGKKQQITDFIQAGMMSPAAGLRLMGFPDLDREQSLETAGIDDIEATMEDLEDEDVPYRAPDPFQDLKMAVGDGTPGGKGGRLHLRYLEIRRMTGVPDVVLDNYRVWIQDAVRLLSTATTPPQVGANMAPYQAGIPAPAGPSVGAPPGVGPGAPGPGAPPPQAAA